MAEIRTEVLKSSESSNARTDKPDPAKMDSSTVDGVITPLAPGLIFAFEQPVRRDDAQAGLFAKLDKCGG